ncbi:hypothetical protein D3C80_836420 [compost metagenome]
MDGCLCSQSCQLVNMNRITKSILLLVVVPSATTIEDSDTRFNFFHDNDVQFWFKEELVCKKPRTIKLNINDNLHIKNISVGLN